VRSGRFMRYSSKVLKKATIRSAPFGRSSASRLQVERRF
jgi:hypothetical protein